MYIIIWEYRVKSERQSEFEKIYSPDGAWAKLFGKGTGYLGTELFHDETNSQRYLTCDRWTSKMDYETYIAQWEKEYKALDAHCEGLTERESLLGRFDSV
jgi:heme-degrading monooxygenase HmoA